MRDVCVVIPMYGFGEYTKKCIEMTLENAGMDVDILIVDDGSETPFYYGHESVFIHRLDENSGFTNATNQGILWCGDKYKYIHLLNNDTEPEKNFIKVLYDLMEANPRIGIASSARKHPSKDSPKGYLIEMFGIDLIRGYQLCCQDDLPQDYYQCNWVPVSSSLVRHEMIRYIGILDRRMRNHCSDNDYCIRARMNNWDVVVVPKSKVFHHHEITTTTHKLSPYDDQKILIEKLAGIQYAQLMKEMPLDHENKTWGKLDFMTYTK